MPDGGIYTPYRQVGYLLPEETTGHPVRCVSLLIPDTIEYRAALVRQLYDLGEAYVWDRTDQAQAESAAQVWRDTLQSSLTMFDDAPCPTDETGCSSFSPGAPFIQWFPNDPYNTPDLVPAGYSSPPWYLATTASNLAYGSSTLDVITTLDRLPPGSLPDVLPSSGLPRFRINVTGQGEINIHLVNLFAGSIIQLTLDDDPLTVKFIDVSKDVISIPPETLQEFIIPVRFDTPGDHHVDCIVLAWVNDTFPFLFFGAGLRQVDLCGFAAMPTVPPTMIRSDPSGCGNLEKSTDGGTTWTDINNTDFLRRDGVCNQQRIHIVNPLDEHGSLTVRKQTDTASSRRMIEVQRDTGARVFSVSDFGTVVMYDRSNSAALFSMQMGQDGNNAVFQGVGGRLWLWGNDAFIGLNYANSNGVGVGGTSVLGLAQFSVLIRDAARRGITIREFTAQTAESFRIENVSGTQIAAIKAGGAAMFNSQVAIQKVTSTTLRDTALFDAAWDVSTDATRAGRFTLSAISYNATREVIRGRADGAAAMVGFLGAAPQPRLALTGDCQGNTVVKSIAELLALFGLATDATTLGTSVLDNLPFVVVDERQKNPALQSLLELGQDAGLWVNSTTEGECCEDFPIFWCKVYDFTVEGDRLGWSLQQGFEGTGGFWNDEAVSQTMFVQREEDANFKIYDLTIDYEYTGSGDFNLYIGGFDFTDPAIASIIGTPAGTGTLTIDLSPGIVFPGGFRIVAIANDTGETIFIKGMTITGFDQGVYDTMGDGNECPPEP